MIYIDFDGVILDTEDLIFEEWRKNPNRHSLPETEKIKYLKKVNWENVLKNSKPINNSINYLLAMNPNNTFILTKIHSLKEGTAKIKWIKKQNIKLKVILVPYYLKKADVVNPNENLLIDDCLKNLHEWECQNGKVIFFDKDDDNYDSWHDQNIHEYERVNDLSKFINNTNIVKLEQYRDTWLSEKFNDVIGFYPREFYPLDNFSSFKVEVDGYLYSSLEEAFQSSLFLPDYPEISNQIKKSHSAHEAQKIMFANIDKVKYSNEEQTLIMEKLLRLKIEQNPYVLKKLLETKDYNIVEDSPKDAFWGWGIDRKGKNKLGKIWMKLREEYINRK